MFRISLFGGFRKKDVIKYLETLGEEKNALQRRIDAATAEENTKERSPEAPEIAQSSDDSAQLIAQMQAQAMELQASIDDLNKKNKLLELEKTQLLACEKHCPELILAIKCQNDSTSTDARRAEEALNEFRRSIAEITREFSGLVDAAAENSSGAQAKTAVKLTSIREILDRVKYISEK